jgi:hypothetical protein
MIRRWSYITQLNALHNISCIPKISTFTHTSFTSTTYFRYPPLEKTTLIRHKWGLRKHVTSWLLSSNVLKDWARLYRFFRNYLRFNLRRHFTPNSFSGLNLITLVNRVGFSDKKNEALVFASFTKAFLSNSQKSRHLSSPRVRTFPLFTTFCVSHMSLPTQAPLDEPDFQVGYAPLILDQSSHISPSSAFVSQQTHVVPNHKPVLLSLPLQVILRILVSVRQHLTILLLLTSCL